MDDIKKIIDNLEKDKGNKQIVKQKFSGWAKELGIQIDTKESEIELWKALDSYDIPESITASGVDLSHNQLNQSLSLIREIGSSPMKAYMTAAGSTSVASSAVVMSGATLSYPPEHLPKAYYNLVKINDQQINQEAISGKLNIIDTSLAVEYNNAWNSFYSDTLDRTRTPMFLMREVVRRIIETFAPDQKVIDYKGLSGKKDIKRQDRLDFIASLLDEITREAFIPQERSLIRIYDELSKAHTPGELNQEETKGYLYQANSLIKLLLDSKINHVDSNT